MGPLDARFTARDTLVWRAAFATTQALAMAIGALAIFAVGALAPFVVPEFGLSRTQLGSLSTAVFAVAAATSLGAGRLVDVNGARKVLLALFVVGAVAITLIAGTRTVWWLWIAAALSGVGQGMANAATNQLIVDHVPAGRRGIQVGIKQSGVPLAQGIAGLTLPPLAVVVGWRGSVLAGVLLAVVGVVMTLLVIPPSAPVTSREAHDKPPLAPEVPWLAGYIFLIGMTAAAVTFHSPLYAFEQLGVSAGLAGTTTGTVGIAGIVGRVLWGGVAERAASPFRVLAALAVTAFAAVLVVLSSPQVGAWLLWPALVAFGASAMAANAVVMFTVVQNAPGGRTGRASGVVSMGLFTGLMIGPLLFGALVDLTGTYSAGWLLAATATLAGLAIAIRLSLHRGGRGI